MRTIRNLDKLQVGHDYKYKELCVLLEEKEEKGNSQKSQLKDWACWFRWSKPTPHKYHIEEIYMAPKQRIDGRTHNGGNNPSKYLALDDIVMEYVSDGEEAAHTLPQFAVELGILTEQYALHKNNIKEFCANNGHSLELVSALLSEIRGTVLKNIQASFERLNAEGFLDVRFFMVLRLVAGGKVELSGADAQRVIEIENEVCEQMGISRADAYKDEHSPNYKKRVNEKILEEFGYEVQFYYKQFKIKKIRDGYKRKSTDDRGKLSRKFVITIGNYMLKFASSYSSENIITNPNTGEDFIISNDIAADTTEVIKCIIELVNYFFVYMNSASWDAYWHNGELDLRSEKKALLFLSQYCLVKMNNDLKNMCDIDKKKEFFREVTESKRDIAIAELGEEVVLEAEYILSGLDWERIFADEAYNERCGKALDSYHKTKDDFVYVEDKHKEDFFLYCAKMVMEAKEDDMLPFYEFVKQFD